MSEHKTEETVENKIQSKASSNGRILRWIALVVICALVTLGRYAWDYHQSHRIKYTQKPQVYDSHGNLLPKDERLPAKTPIYQLQDIHQ